MNETQKVFFGMVHFKLDMEGTCTIVAKDKEEAAEKVMALFSNRDDVKILEIISQDEAPGILELMPDGSGTSGGSAPGTIN